MISMDKNYRTEGGLEVRIYAVDGGGKALVHGAFLDDDVWYAFQWSVDGQGPYADHDLIEVVMIPEYWVVFTANGKIAFVVNQEPNQLPEDCFSIHHPAQEKPS